MRLLIPYSACLGLLLTVHAEGQTNDYRAIFERNAFRLKPPEEATLPLPPPGPAADFHLMGLAEYDGTPQALFSVIQPGKPPVNFNLREGEQNDWLEVKSIQTREEKVKIVLKKPLNQLRNVGVELVLSMTGGEFKHPDTQ